MIDATDQYVSWIGKTETVEDDIALAPALAAAATLDDSVTPLGHGRALPPLWHWFYFLPKAPQSRLGADGHPERGGFMPPIPFPRRMFAGARLRFHHPLRIGGSTSREGVIRNVVLKSGRSGSLAFVTVGYSFHQDGVLCIEEEQDIVYREPGAPVPAPAQLELPPVAQGAWSRVVTPDTRLLFRFSALTFNAHRIHYDRPYAMSEEGYPGLVVHGPLTAVLLIELVRHSTPRSISGYSFRGLAPIFDLAPFRLVGMASDSKVELEAQGPDGKTAMSATAELAG
jgi:3-methylfumaryl-CoA hydratase